MTVGEQRRCAYQTCQAWPKRGTVFCVAHQGGIARRVGGAPPGNQNARVHGIYSKYASTVDVAAALGMDRADLRLKMAVVRAPIADVLASPLDPVTKLEALNAGTAALARLIRAQVLLAGEEGVEGKLDQVM